MEDNSVQLVSVANALHWFEFDRFFAEVKRILVPNGVLMVWSDQFQNVVVQEEEKSKELTSLMKKVRVKCICHIYKLLKPDIFIYVYLCAYRFFRLYWMSTSLIGTSGLTMSWNRTRVLNFHSRSKSGI